MEDISSDYTTFAFGLTKVVIMKYILFKTLSALNKKVLPSYIYKDLNNLSNIDKLIIGYKIWVTKNFLDLKK